LFQRRLLNFTDLIGKPYHTTHDSISFSVAPRAIICSTLLTFDSCALRMQIRVSMECAGNSNNKLRNPYRFGKNEPELKKSSIRIDLPFQSPDNLLTGIFSYGSTKRHPEYFIGRYSSEYLRPTLPKTASRLRSIQTEYAHKIALKLKNNPIIVRTDK
jgi:hypothetical protein